MQVVHRLLDMGVDVNHELTRKRPYGAGRGRFEDYDLRGGVGPLFIATIRQDHEAMEALLAHGAEVDLENVLQMTPLMIAAGMRGTGRAGGGAGTGAAAAGDPQARTIKSIDLLLAAGADINTRVTNSRTHTAKIMAYVQGRDQEGRTALFAAAEAGSDKVVKHLLERGADPTVRDAAGKTALDVARDTAPGRARCGSSGGGISSSRGCGCKPRGDHCASGTADAQGRCCGCGCGSSQVARPTTIFPSSPAVPRLTRRAPRVFITLRGQQLRRPT